MFKHNHLLNFFLCNLLLLAVIIAITATTYRGLSTVFFQQDEWMSISEVMLIRGGGLPGLYNWLISQRTHFVPLSLFSFMLEFILFGVDNHGYGIVAIVLQALNVFVLYYLLKKVLYRPFSLIISLILFATSAVGIQGITWFATNIAVQASSLCFMISLLAWHYALTTLKRRYILASCIFLVCALLFKEDALSLIFILPLVTFAHHPISQVVKKSAPVLVTGAIYLITRKALLMLTGQTILQGVSAVEMDTTFYIERALRIFSQIILTLIPAEIFTKNIGEYYFAHVLNSDKHYQIEFLPKLLAVLTVIFVLCSTILLKATKNKRSAITLISLAISLVPYFFAYGPIDILPSRYLYLPSILASILIGHIFDRLIIDRSLLLIPMTILVVFLVLKNVQISQNFTTELNRKSQIRFAIVNQLKQLVKNNSSRDRYVYYLTGDPINYDPLQSSLGHMLLVLIADHNKEFVSFLPAVNLWNTGNDYLHQKDRVFMFFEYDPAPLMKLVNEKVISCNEIRTINFSRHENALTISHVLLPCKS